MDDSILAFRERLQHREQVQRERVRAAQLQVDKLSSSESEAPDDGSAFGDKQDTFDLDKRQNS